MVDDGDDKSIIGVEDDVEDFKIGGETVGLAEEQVGEKDGGVVGMGSPNQGCQG